mmetsp:Transcript_4314/g.6282  ORF Transcript_4314/g.6282 Transcript_4314/m.6282 type:complete len:310 (+) Transcript_4314:190-1119(+)
MNLQHTQWREESLSRRSQIRALCDLEASGQYQVQDYLSDDREKRYTLNTSFHQQRSIHDAVHSNGRVLFKLDTTAENRKWRASYSRAQEVKMSNKIKLRQMIFLWAFKVVDTIEVDRSLVVFFASLLDRFMTIVRCSKDGFRLASMTAFYVAFKLHRPGKKSLSIDDLVLLSDGQFMKQDIEEMELIFLDTLFWKMNGPTPLCFLHSFDLHLPYNREERMMLPIAEYLIELSVLDLFFCDHLPSVIALASYQIATEGGASNVFHVTNVEPNWSDVCTVKQRLIQTLDPIAGVDPGANAQSSLMARLRGL